jgi:hypothetical protein
MSTSPCARTLLSACAAALAVLPACQGPIDEEVRQAFLGRLGSVSFTVYPAHLDSGDGEGWDRPSAERLAAAIEALGCGTATVADVQVPVRAEPGMNQARMFRESAEGFAAWVAAHPPATDYAVWPEFLGFSGTREVGGLHLYVCSRDGTLVDGQLLNSHHEPFRAAHPVTAAQCAEVLVEVLRADWKPAR